MIKQDYINVNIPLVKRDVKIFVVMDKIQKSIDKNVTSWIFDEKLKEFIKRCYENNDKLLFPPDQLYKIHPYHGDKTNIAFGTRFS